MLKSSIMFGWGFGSLGLAVILNTLNVLLIAYLTLVVGIEPATAGSLILIAKLYDVLTDLPMGWLSDRTRSRWGKRRPYLFAAALITPLALFLLYSPPVGDPKTYVLACLLLYASGYTLFNVPYLSMPAELCPDTHIRSRMVAWRSLFIAGGTLFGVSIAPFMVGQLGSGSEAYQSLGLVMAALVAFTFLVCVALMPSGTATEVSESPLALSRQLLLVFGNRHFRNLMMIKVLHLLALSVGAGSYVFFFRFVLGYDLQTLGLYGAVTTLVWALSMPFWTKVARVRGKRFGYAVATLAYSLLTFSWYFASANEPMALLLGRAVLFGAISGGMLLMGNAMLQDIMDEDFRRNGQRKNGLFAGSYSLVEKVTSGLGAQILGFVLSYAGFSRLAAVQSEEAVAGIVLATAVIPGLLMLISLGAIHAYALREDQLGNVRLDQH